VAVLKDILGKVNDNCILINYISAEIGGIPEGGHTESTISILCDKDKQEYLSKVRKWQKEENFREEVRNKAILLGSSEFEAVGEAWEDFWADLEPDKNKNYLKDIPKIDIQFIDQDGLYGTSGVLIKVTGEVEELKNNKGCMLVNYVHADFGEERKLSWEEQRSLCPTENYSIKNKVAVFCDEDKKEYLDNVGKWQQKYFSERDEQVKHDNEFDTWINFIWKNLEPNKNLIERIPFLDVHYMKLHDDPGNLGALKIEVKGEINHRWDYPIDYELPPYLKAELFDKDD